MTHDGPSSSSAPASLPWRVARLALAWLPFFVTWVLFLRVFAREPLAGAFFSGLGAVATAAILGLGVWWLTGRLTWPDRIRPGFYAAHLVAGAIYAAAWTGTAHLLALAFITYMALRCRSIFAKLVAAGVGLTLFAYVFINVAMVTGLVPVVGVPLPLVSYGGTSMLTMIIGLGFVLNAHVNRRVTFRRSEVRALW